MNNEIGSVHRCGIAVFLATHGLAVVGVLGGDFVSVPLAFETEQATDDWMARSANRFLQDRNANAVDLKGTSIRGPARDGRIKIDEFDPWARMSSVKDFARGVLDGVRRNHQVRFDELFEHR